MRRTIVAGGFVGSWGGFGEAFGGFVGPPGGFGGGVFSGKWPLFSTVWWLWRVYFFVFEVVGVLAGRWRPGIWRDGAPQEVRGAAATIGGF